MSFRVVIPARYGSKRLPGKPLRSLAGTPVISHVWRRATESGANRVIVATDNQQIADVVQNIGGEAMLTDPDHVSGTDRVAEVAAKLGWKDDTVLINLQGDEPCMPAALITALARSLLTRPEIGMATIATPIRSSQELLDPNTVKVVFDDDHIACYFSRAPIPWVRGIFPLQDSSELPENIPFFKHLGLYAYRVHVLRRICEASCHPLEQAEYLEQLRALALGINIFVLTTPECPGHGVDTEQDLRQLNEQFSSIAR